MTRTSTICVLSGALAAFVLPANASAETVTVRPVTPTVKLTLPPPKVNPVVTHFGTPKWNTSNSGQNNKPKEEVQSDYGKLGIQYEQQNPKAGGGGNPQWGEIREIDQGASIPVSPRPPANPTVSPGPK